MQLWEAQAYDTLNNIRHFLRIVGHLWAGRRKHARGQKENTCAGTLIPHTQGKLAASIAHYRHAWAALCSLMGTDIGSEQGSLRQLKDSHVRGLTDPYSTKTKKHQQTEGRREMSWIWSAGGLVTGDEEADDPNVRNSAWEALF